MATLADSSGNELCEITNLHIGKVDGVQTVTFNFAFGFVATIRGSGPFVVDDNGHIYHVLLSEVRGTASGTQGAFGVAHGVVTMP